LTGAECVADARAVRVDDDAQMGPGVVGEALLEGDEGVGGTVGTEEQDLGLSIPIEIGQDRFTLEV
jgi:hypothetical protein